MSEHAPDPASSAEAHRGPAPAAPRADDLLIVPDHQSGVTVFLIQQQGHEPQVFYPSRDQAEALAARFAERCGVDVWFVRDRTATLVRSFRSEARGPGV